MKILTTLILFQCCLVYTHAQKNPFDYPDTLWVYGQSSDSNYGRTASNPIKVGGGTFPKNNYTYLNNLSYSSGKSVIYKRIGSCSSPDVERKKPLTCFEIQGENGNWITLFFDQYEFEKPLIISGYKWTENRRGYHGEFVNDSIFQGKGVYFFDDGGYYKGEWINGIMEGKGTMYVVGVEKYTGEFKGGKYNGYGRMDYPDGGYYEGTWKDSERHGMGKLFYPPRQDIVYIEGVFVKGKPVGEFTIVTQDGKTEKHKF